MIGTLAVDVWAVTLGTARRAPAPPSPLLAVPDVTVHLSSASVPASYYSTWHYNIATAGGLREPELSLVSCCDAAARP